MIAKSKIVGLVLSICLSVALILCSVIIFKTLNPSVWGRPEGYCEIIISPSDGGYLNASDGSTEYKNGGIYEVNGSNSVVFTAIPYEGYVFSHWGTGQTENNLTYSQIVQSYSGDYDCAIYCYFVSGSPVEVETNDSTLGTVTGGGVFDEGESVTITATPTNIGYFSHWQDESGNSVSTSSTYTFTVSGSATYTAVFKAKSYITTQSADNNMGTVSGGGYFLPTNTCTIVASPNKEFKFLYWKNSAGTIVSYSSTYTFTASSSNTYTAYFKQISVSFITPNSGAEIKEEISDIGSAIIEISLIFNSGYYVNSIKLGTQDAISLKSLTGTISGGEYCTAVRYTANESGSEVLIEVMKLKADLPITLGFASTAQSLKLSTGAGVSTVAITSTIGGSVTLIGDDFENLADTDTITCVAKVCVQGYEFVGWYKSSDMDTAISTNASVRFSKADIYGEEIIAVFRQINNTSVNDQTSN